VPRNFSPESLEALTSGDKMRLRAQRDSADSKKTHEDLILLRLEADWPSWTAAPVLAQISLQYGSRILSLRRKGWLIMNRISIVGGIRHGEFRLGSAPASSSRELRQRHPTVAPSKQEPEESLFDNLAPERRYPD
jgi:hypothetical protein